MDIHLDHGPGGRAVRFGQPLALGRADSVADVDDALAELETARAGGHWLAGFASYETRPCARTEAAAAHARSTKTAAALQTTGILSDFPKDHPDMNMTNGSIQVLLNHSEPRQHQDLFDIIEKRHDDIQAAKRQMEEST